MPLLSQLFELALYTSGLLVWPGFRWLWRRKHRPTPTLRAVFWLELIAQAALSAGYGIAPPWPPYRYQWLLWLIQANLAFTLLAIIAAIRDYRRARTIKD